MSKIKPWKSIWFNPKETISALTEEQSPENRKKKSKEELQREREENRSGLPKVVGTLFLITPLSISILSSPLHLVFFFIGMCFLSPIITVIESIIIYGTSKIFKSTASYDEYETVIVWSQVPALLCLLVWGIVSVLKGGNPFAGSIASPEGALNWGWIAAYGVFVISPIWMFYITVSGVKEIEKWGHGKCFSVAALTYIFVVGAIFASKMFWYS